ncbi:MAG: hypothetical protein Q4G58_03220 [bacterium]|nr:hypothetical protein [bacterium]
MQEKIKGIFAKVKEFWDKYTKKQKGIVLSVLGVIVISIIILALVLTRKTYETLLTCEDTKTASSVMELLKGQGIDCNLASDNKTINVLTENYEDAVIAVGSSDLTSEGMTYEQAFKNDMSTSESEKNTKKTLALQTEVRSKILKMDGIADATVFINQPVDDYTILSEANKATVSVMLEFNKNASMSSDNAASLASFLANIVGTDTNQITIIDNNSKVIFNGSEGDTLGGQISSTLEYKEKYTNTIVSNVTQMLLKYGDYKDVEIGSANIKYNMDKVSELYTEYSAAEGQDQGMLSSNSKTETVGSAATSGGTPGTDSNDDDTQYDVEESEASENSSKSETNNYLPNKKDTSTEYEVGAVLPDQSSMALVLTTYKVYDQEKMERNDQLNGATWDEFVEQNDKKTQLEVPADVYTQVQMATGISTSNLSVTAWEQPIFQDKQEEETNFDTIIMIGLIVLIVGLLGFVVFKVAKPVEVVEQEPELSVEDLLATTKENQDLEDIEYGEKSETRKMIEKFVDENPEAVAQLLRNWLNDDWG